jgi:ADP-heptose:LPS heptosyltransferase
VRGLLDIFPTARVILLGASGDAARAADVLAELPPDKRGLVVDTCGRVALADLPALVARLDVFIGVDSGLTYMADALNVPVVSVAGPCNMAETRPVGRHAIIIQRNLPCLPCAHIFHAPSTCRVGTLACIRDIDAPEIVAAVRKCLDGAAK